MPSTDDHHLTRLTLSLGDEVLLGETSPDEARQLFAQHVAEMTYASRPPPQHIAT